MGNCEKKPKNNCFGSKINASCVQYEGELPDNYEDDCDVRVDETLEYLFEHQGGIENSIDLSELGDTCIEYDQEGDVLQVKEVLKKFEELIATKECEDGTGNTNGSTTTDPIINCDLDFYDFKDPCNEPIGNITECEFKQFILDTLNDLNNRITALENA